MAQDDKNNQGIDIEGMIAAYGGGAISKYAVRQIVYRQGDPASTLYYIVSGTVKVTFNSEFGKEAVIAILGAGDFFGEGCLNGDFERRTTVATTSECEIARVDRAVVQYALIDDPAFSKLFIKFLLARNEKLKTDLIDQMFNSSEKRLARILLTLANIGQAEQSSVIGLPINQELLANMVGTTRSRVNQFMNKFRKMGYIDYGSQENSGQIKVYHSLVNMLLDD